MTPSLCRSCQTVYPLSAGADGRASCPGCGALIDVATSCDVFVSFASEDLDQARQVVTAFTAAGIGCWLAPERIEVGESFLQEIDTALACARVLVLVLSRHAVTSPWVEMEVTRAKSSGCRILPLKIDDFEVPRTYRMLLSHHQWQDTGSDFERAIDGLINRTREELVRRAAAPASLSAATSAREPPTPVAPEGVNPQRSPYVGPRPFSSRMADRFFGRQREAESLLRLITQSSPHYS
ncbi:MAG: toll/interleukin-1 receptor domain-containing protein [Vicinamibacterales bacterium]